MAQQKYEGSMFSPSVVAAEMSAVDNHLKAMVERIASTDMDDKIREAFLVFAREWVTFYEDNDDIFHRSLNSTRMKVADYRNRVNDWQKLLKKQGLTGLPILSRVAESGDTPWRLILIGGAAVVVVAGGLWGWAQWNAIKN